MIEIIDPRKIEKIAHQIHESIPKEIRNFGDEIEKKVRQILQAQLTRLNFISREEFDVQTQILLSTREKLTFLEQRLNQIESRNTDMDHNYPKK